MSKWLYETGVIESDEFGSMLSKVERTVNKRKAMKRYREKTNVNHLRRLRMEDGTCVFEEYKNGEWTR